MAASLSPRPFQHSNPLDQDAQHPSFPSSFPGSPFHPRSAIKRSSTTLMERRGRAPPKLQVRSFHTAGSDQPPPATPYNVLGILPTASEGEVKSAYRRLARQYHPDRAPLHEKEASTNKFLQIHSAYSVLSDPSRRAQYDMQRSLDVLRSTGYNSRYPHTSRADSSASAPSSTYCSPRSPFSSGSRGRSWETDQCWC